MENNLSKAISQIKFPVRYEDGHIWDSENYPFMFIGGYVFKPKEQYLAFVHALADWLNGLDAEFDDAEEQYRQDIMSLAIDVANIFYYAGRKKEYADLPNDIAELFNGGELKYPTYPKRVIGLDGRGKEVAIPTDQCIEDWYGNSKVGDNSSELEWIKSAVKYFMGTWQGNSKPDRQVKSAEEIEEEEKPVLVGTLKKEFGYKSMQPVMEGTEVYEYQGYYQFDVTTKAGVVFQQRFYKDTLAPEINFLQERSTV